MTRSTSTSPWVWYMGQRAAERRQKTLGQFEIRTHSQAETETEPLIILLISSEMQCPEGFGIHHHWVSGFAELILSKSFCLKVIFFFVVGVVEWTKLITSFQLWLAFSVCLWDSFWRKGIHIEKFWKKHRIFFCLGCMQTLSNFI